VVVSPLPVYHIYAFTCSLHAPLLTGNTLVTMKRFDTNQCLALIEQHRGTHLHVVPPVVLALAKSPDLHKYDLSSLRVAMSAAAPLASEQEKEFATNLDCIIKQAWGMSELSPIGTYTPDHLVQLGNGSCGFPVSGTSIKVVDLETGEALPPGQEGEFCIKGPQVSESFSVSIPPSLKPQNVLLRYVNSDYLQLR
jgi:acyl-CoA synthetase (AMP-forming)/AMP-acid ligase II